MSAKLSVSLKTQILQNEPETDLRLVKQTVANMNTNIN